MLPAGHEFMTLQPKHNIQEEVNLGDLPLRADLLIIRRDPIVPLPYPFNHLGATTLVEFKGPDDSAGQADLLQLESYGLLYQQRTKLARRSELTLWLVASSLARGVSQRDGAYLTRAQRVGPGVRAGSLDRFPTCLVNLNELPISGETLPLLMVSRGPQERAVVEFLVDHRKEYAEYAHHLFAMHKKVFTEVFIMRELTLEEWGIEYPEEFATDLVQFFGEERI
jgi:hypothetical protein